MSCPGVAHAGGLAVVIGPETRRRVTEERKSAKKTVIALFPTPPLRVKTATVCTEYSQGDRMRRLTHFSVALADPELESIELPVAGGLLVSRVVA